MPGLTVDRIGVEIVADARVMDQSMRRAEQRVDQAANKMAGSVNKVDRRISGLGGGALGGRIAGMPARVLGGFLGAVALGGAARAYADSLEQGDTSASNIASNLARQLPILRDIVSIADVYYRKLTNIAELEGQGARMDIIRGQRAGLNVTIEDLERRARLAGARTDNARRKVEIQMEMEELQKLHENLEQSIRSVGSTPQVQNERLERLDNAIGAIMGGLRRQMRAPANQAQFASFDTVLGQYKARIQTPAAPHGKSVAEDAKITAKATQASVRLLQQILQSIGRNGLVLFG